MLALWSAICDERQARWAKGKARREEAVLQLEDGRGWCIAVNHHERASRTLEYMYAQNSRQGMGTLFGLGTCVNVVDKPRLLEMPFVLYREAPSCYPLPAQSPAEQQIVVPWTRQKTDHWSHGATPDLDDEC